MSADTAESLWKPAIGMSSLQKNPASAAAPAPAKALWPDQYSGDVAAVPRCSHVDSPCVYGFGSESADTMAAVGRQCRNAAFVTVVGPTVSESAIARSANRRVFSANGIVESRVTRSAIWIQAPGGCEVPLPRLQKRNVASLSASG